MCNPLHSTDFTYLGLTALSYIQGSRVWVKKQLIQCPSFVIKVIWCQRHTDPASTKQGSKGKCRHTTSHLRWSQWCRFCGREKDLDIKRWILFYFIHKFMEFESTSILSYYFITRGFSLLLRRSTTVFLTEFHQLCFLESDTWSYVQEIWNLTIGHEFCMAADYSTVQ